ncbi:MAG TPA: response regulator [Steroidobacteraceae bacterium]|nr:response regulator [Steroidobacteraceae bacterium]
MKERQPTISVVDDDAAARSSLRLLLKSLGLAATAYDSAAAFLASHSPQQPGCLLLDIRMPGMSGLELQEELNRRGSLTPIIFITGHGDVPMAVEAMQHGAFDFLQKPFRDQELLDRVQRALAKDRSVRDSLLEHDTIRRRLDSLTEREHDVLELVTGGAPNKIIAHKLGISQRTVEIHRARVMEKMSADSLAQLVHMTMAAGATRSQTLARNTARPS